MFYKQSPLLCESTLFCAHRLYGQLLASLIRVRARRTRRGKLLGIQPSHKHAKRTFVLLFKDDDTFCGLLKPAIESSTEELGMVTEQLFIDLDRNAFWPDVHRD